MNISLIVCTRNRANHLPATLEAFSRMHTAEPWQLIIVNNASTDETQDLLDRFAARDPEHVTIVQQPVPGLANAQNAGLRHAAGDVIAFTDDDCYPEPDYLERIRECFQEAPIQYLGGRVLLYDRDDAPVTIQTRNTRVDLAPYCYVSPGIIHGAAFAFTRQTMQALGGFDPALGIGGALDSGNDINALIRCSAMGFRGAYDPRPTVYHHHRRRATADVERLLKRYDVSRGAAYYFGISNPGTRRAYLWPVVRRLAGNLLKGHWGTLRRECSGGYRYACILRSRSVGQ
jgi:glycosyltransferase involved in cell wall biosynthesis